MDRGKKYNPEKGDEENLEKNGAEGSGEWKGCWVKSHGYHEGD